MTLLGIDAAAEALHNVKDMITRTFDEHVLKEIGSFGAMYQLDTSAMEEPVLDWKITGT